MDGAIQRKMHEQGVVRARKEITLVISDYGVDIIGIIKSRKTRKFTNID